MTDATGETPRLDLAPGADAQENARLLTLIVYGLYLAGLVTCFATTIAGVIVAYVSRAGAPAWARTHYDFQIRTFWYGLVMLLLFIPFIIAWFVTGAVLSIVLIGIPILLAGVLLIFAPAAWFIARCAVGLSYAANTQAYPRPEALIV